MMEEHQQRLQLVVHNVGDFQHHPSDHDPNLPLLTAEHHQSQLLGVRNDFRSVLESLPPGFKFLPTDLELIEFYLKPKLQNWLFPPEFKKPFLDVELYMYNPAELIGMHDKLEEDQESWYFFTPRELKYQKGNRPQRTAPGGYWKATGKDTPIVDNVGVVGYRKALDFFTGTHAKGDRSEWKMHEYLTNEQKDNLNLPSTNQNPTNLNDWVLCKIYKNQRGTKRKDGPEAEQEEQRRNEYLQEKDEVDRRIDALLANDSLLENMTFGYDHAHHDF